MKAKEYSVFEGGERDYHQPVNAGEQTIHRESSIGVCPRDEELSSMDRGVQQTGDWQKKATEDFLKGGHRDNPGKRGRNGSSLLMTKQERYE